jgi:hypothetical protein
VSSRQSPIPSWARDSTLGSSFKADRNTSKALVIYHTHTADKNRQSICTAAPIRRELQQTNFKGTS